MPISNADQESIAANQTYEHSKFIAARLDAVIHLLILIGHAASCQDCKGYGFIYGFAPPTADAPKCKTCGGAGFIRT